MPLDLAVPWSGSTQARRLLGLLDVVRGVRPRRVVVAGSDLGWRLLSTYGPTLRHEMSLAAVLTEPGEDDADGGDFQGCFDRLDWVVTDSDGQRDELAVRYLLPAASRARVLSPADCAAGASPQSRGSAVPDAVPQVAAIITAHAEGVMAGLSFRSLLDAVAVARAEGIDVEVLVVLDNPTDATRATFAEAGEHGAAVAEVSYADQGKVRNHAVGLVSAGHVAFLDGDDLWSENWLVDAYRMCAGSADGDRVIGHPELNWFFENQQNLYFLPDQTDPAFDPALLRIANPWDALCLAPRTAYVEHPFAKRAVADGYAYEDWHWMLETYLAGYVHRVVPETIHFKRRREGSQYVQARARSVLTRPSELLDFAWWQERDRVRCDARDARSRMRRVGYRRRERVTSKSVGPCPSRRSRTPCFSS